MISKTAIETEAFRKEIIFTNSAREGWELILKTLKPNSNVLLPSYIGVTDREGSGIYDPISNLGVAHDFYLLNPDLSISIEEIENSLLENKYDLILLVHYFGFKIKNIEDIVSLCKKHNLLVVEDCAHLYSYNLSVFSDAGSFGDYVFYSLHKNFPLKKGGLVVQNNKKLGTLSTNEIQLKENLSYQLLQYDAEKIARKRQENYKILDSEIKYIEGVYPLRSLATNDIPHTYPIIVENGLRERLYFWLIERNITLIALYYKLIKPINKENFQSMYDLSDSILNLPVHQDINKQELIYLSKFIAEGIKELNK